MELKILEERANPLLQRTEYRFEITHAEAPTPTIDQVRGELSKQLKVPKERLVIERMHARFGAPQTRGEALAYKSADAAKSISREHILIRNGLKEKAVGQAPGTEAAPVAAPAAPAPPTAEPGPAPKPPAPAEGDAAAKPAKPPKAAKAPKAPAAPDAQKE